MRILRLHRSLAHSHDNPFPSVGRLVSTSSLSPVGSKRLPCVSSEVERFILIRKGGLIVLRASPHRGRAVYVEGGTYFFRGMSPVRPTSLPVCRLTERGTRLPPAGDLREKDFLLWEFGYLILVLPQASLRINPGFYSHLFFDGKAISRSPDASKKVNSVLFDPGFHL